MIMFEYDEKIYNLSLLACIWRDEWENEEEKEKDYKINMCFAGGFRETLYFKDQEKRDEIYNNIIRRIGQE